MPTRLRPAWRRRAEETRTADAVQVASPISRLAGVAVAERLKARFASPYAEDSLGARARRKRMAILVDRFPDISDMHIVDLGGDTRLWRMSTVRPHHVTIVDIASWALEDPEPWMTVVQGDACDSRTISGHFDLVFSNGSSTFWVGQAVTGPAFSLPTMR